DLIINRLQQVTRDRPMRRLAFEGAEAGQLINHVSVNQTLRQQNEEELLENGRKRRRLKALPQDIDQLPGRDAPDNDGQYQTEPGQRDLAREGGRSRRRAPRS